MNFLEQLVAEWYAYKGCFVRTNIRFGKRDEGGYNGEMDVVAFEPNSKTLIHIETSMDAKSWEDRKSIFSNKFLIKERYKTELKIDEIINIEKIAVVSLTNPIKVISFDDNIKLLTIPNLVKEITEEIKKKDPAKEAISESYPLLRAIQFAVAYGIR